MRWSYPQERSFQLVVGQTRRMQECVPARIFVDVVRYRRSLVEGDVQLGEEITDLHRFPPTIFCTALRSAADRGDRRAADLL